MNRLNKLLILLLFPFIFAGSNYPAALDSDSNLYHVESGQLVSPNHHNAVKDALKAVQGFVGTNITTDPVSVNYRINHIKGRVVDFASGSFPRAIIFIPAGSFAPTLQNGASEPGIIDIGTSYRKSVYPLQFGDTISTKAHVLLGLPSNCYYTGGIEVRSVFTFTSAPIAGETVKFAFHTLPAINGTNLDVAFSNNATCTFTVPSSPSMSKLYVTDWTSVGIGTTPDQLTFLQVSRDIDDTATAELYLLGIQIRYQVSRPDGG